jgi:site-specific DNA-adenine methylase
VKSVFRYYGGKFNQLKDILAILSNIAFAREMYSSKLNK